MKALRISCIVRNLNRALRIVTSVAESSGYVQIGAVWITRRGRDSAREPSIDIEQDVAQNVRLNTKTHFVLARYAEDTFERNDRCIRPELGLTYGPLRWALQYR